MLASNKKTINKNHRQSSSTWEILHDKDSIPTSNDLRDSNFSVTSWQSVSCLDSDLADPNALQMTEVDPNDKKSIASILSDSSSDLEDENRDPLLQSDQDNEEIINSSLIIPSFIMPRVSIPSQKKQLVKRKSYSPNLQLNIQVVGENSLALISRLSAYRKTLRSVRFQLTDTPPPKAVLLILGEEPAIVSENKPVVPIYFENNDNATMEAINSNNFICKPVKLKSVNDDLMILIDFLGCLGTSYHNLGTLMNGGLIGSSKRLNNVNSTLIESTIVPSKGQLKHIKRKHKKDRLLQVRRIKKSLFVGFTFGAISLALAILWREFYLVDSKASVSDVEIPRVWKSVQFFLGKLSGGNKVPDIDNEAIRKLHAEVMESWQKYLVGYDDFPFLQLTHFSEEASELRTIVASKALILLERIKATALHLLSIF